MTRFMESGFVVCILFLFSSINVSGLSFRTVRSSYTTNILGNYVDSQGSRRHFLSAAIAVTTGATTIGPSLALADSFEPSIPTVTTTEFESILKTGAKSVRLVQFSGPKSETAVVTLVDGTVFGISDLVESSIDPRSPLRLVATLRGYNVPYKFTLLEAAVGQASTRGKRKVFLNEATIIANKKTEDQKDRMAKDEEERVAALKRMTQ